MVYERFDAGRISHAPPVPFGVDDGRWIVAGRGEEREDTVVEDVAVVHRTRR